MAERGEHLRGTKLPGSGRKMGMKNISTLLFEQVMEKYQDKIDDGTFVTPLSYWVTILNDEDELPKVRDRAAERLAKYLHSSMPVMVEQTINDVTPHFKIEFVASKDEYTVSDQD